MTEGLPLADELTSVFTRMSGLVLTRESVSSALDLVTSLAADTIPEAAGCGVSLLDERGRRTTAAATDSRVEEADGLQYELLQGPCLTAWAERVVVRVDDTRSEQRWARWCAAVQQVGLRSALSAPLVADQATLGAIKVYGEEADAFGAQAEDLLTRFAPQAAVLVANVQAFERARQLSEGLQEALRTRDVIGTAKGIVMAREGVDEEAAFAMLVSVSQRQNLKLRDVAEGLVARTLRRRR